MPTKLQSSSEVLNAIRSEATQAYQDRVPLAKAASLQEVGSAILEYNDSRNEFVQMLVNRIGKVVISDKMYENPLKEFKKGMLECGKSIEEVFVDLVDENFFDVTVAESELYKRNLPDVKAIFHEINRKGFYKTTIENEILSLAFTSEQGMNNLVEKIVSKLYTSDEYDEFLYMKDIIKRAGENGQFTVVKIADPTDEASAKLAMTKIKEVSNSMTFMKDSYNFAGVKTHTPKEDQIILINPAFDALIDVEVLAAAFNMSKADFIGRRVLVDDFGGLQDVACIVVDRSWFMVYDKLIRTEELYNPQGLYYNYWLHHWQVLSASLFHNAVAFVTGTTGVAAVTGTNVSVKKGESVQLDCKATKGVSATNFDSSCRYKITGGNPTSKLTTVNSLGFVVIGEDETTSDITVTATSKQDPSKTKGITITVTT